MKEATPVDLAETTELMQGVASALDECLNGKGTKPKDKKVAFVVLLANFGELDGGRVNYVSNAEREDIITVLKELIGRWEKGDVTHEQ